MSHNLLIDPLPDQVRVGGLVYKINTDFRIGILFELMMQNPELHNEDRTYLMLHLYYGDQPVMAPDFKEAIDQILWFYRCGREIKEPEADEPVSLDPARKRANKPQKQIFSYDHDDGLIYAAYMEQYGVDLTNADLHWWQFRAFFEGLSDDVKLSKVMGYRAMDIDSKMPDKQKAFYKRMKRIYALPDMRSAEEKEADFAAALW